MQFFNAFFVQWQFFLQWLEDLGFLNPINQEESIPESSPVAIQMEHLPVAIQMQSLPKDIKTESLQVVIQTVNVSQQTDVVTQTQKASVLEEKLTEQVNDLKRQLGETIDVSEERKRKAQKLEKDLDFMAAQHKLEIAKINSKRSQEIIFKEIELIQIQDDCDNQIVDLELSNAKLMEIIVQLETKQAPVPHIVPSCEIAIHRKFPPLPTIIKAKSQHAGEQSAAGSEQRPKHQALISEKVKGKCKAEVAKQPEDKPDSSVRCKNKPMESCSHNPLDGTTQVQPGPPKKATTPEPAPGFTIISKEIKQTEHRDMLILSDIHQTLYGRVVGRGGENVKRMQMSHGVSISMVKSKTHEEFCNMIIRGGNPEKHQAAAREVLESLPVTIECPSNVNLKRLGAPEFKKLINPLFVKITRPIAPNGKVTISGRINNCRKAYELLVKDGLPPSLAK